MHIIGTMSLGARERIVLLQVADKHILVAVTAQSISPLHVFEEELPTEFGDLDNSEEKTRFSALLQSLGSGQPR